MAKKKCVRKGVMCGHRRFISNNAANGGTMCHYLLDTGEQRGCPSGRKCKHYTTKKCAIRKD